MNQKCKDALNLIATVEKEKQTAVKTIVDEINELLEKLLEVQQVENESGEIVRSLEISKPWGDDAAWVFLYDCDC